MKPSAVHPLPAFAQWLAYAVLIPFVLLAAMVRWLPATDHKAAAFAWGVVPSLLVWLALLLAPTELVP